MSKRYVVLADEYACDGVWITQVVARGTKAKCLEYADLINLGGADQQYQYAEVMSEEEYEKEEQE